MQRNNGDLYDYDVFNLQHTSVLKAQTRQHISNIYIYLYVSDQSMYIGSEVAIKALQGLCCSFQIKPLYMMNIK